MQQISTKGVLDNLRVYEWVERVIYLELFKKYKFDHMSKCDMHQSESVQVKETH